MTAGSGYHLLHVPPCGPAERLALYLWLDRARGNLAMGQRSLRLIGDSLAGGPDAVAGRADLLAGRVDSAGGRVASPAGRAVESAR